MNETANATPEGVEMETAEQLKAPPHADTSGSVKEIAELEIRSIARPENHRLPELADKAALQELADSMRAEGQLVAVRVYERSERGHEPRDGQPYLLCDGYRRLAAAELNGWTTIRAEICPPAVDAHIQAARAVANLHRQNLNVMEEANAVAQLIESHEDTGRPSETVIADVAAMLGKSAAWVRERSYMSRISDDVKQLALAGLLQPGHLLELAKVGDPERQYGLAHAALWNGNYVRAMKAQERKRDIKELRERAVNGGGTRLPVDRVRKLVDQLKRPLKRVPWALDQAVAGKPACAGCPHNTATDQTLFGGDASGDPAEGQCLNESCYQVKVKAAEKEKQKVVAKLKKKKAEPTAEAVDQAKPDWLKRGPAQNAAKKELGTPKAKTSGAGESASAAAGGHVTKKKATRGAGGKTPEERKYEARRQLMRAVRAWEEARIKAIAAEISENPARLPALLLLTAHPAWREQEIDLIYHDPPKFAAITPTLTRLIDAAAHLTDDIALATQAQAALESGAKRRKSWAEDVAENVVMDANAESIAHLSAKLGLDTPAPPAWDDYKPKPEAEASAKASGGKKKATRNKSTKKKATT